MGVRSKKDLEDAIGFYSSGKEARDYFFIADMEHQDCPFQVIVRGKMQKAIEVLED